MSQQSLSVRRLMRSIVPITRFNRGEASKIFDEVSEAGVKVVLKNNAPVGVIVKPERYEEMIEIIEDYALYFEAEQRLKNPRNDDLLSEAQVLESLGVSDTDLNGGDAELEE